MSENRGRSVLDVLKRYKGILHLGAVILVVLAAGAYAAVKNYLLLHYLILFFFICLTLGYTIRRERRLVKLKALGQKLRRENIERRHGEEDLRLQKAYFQQLFESSPEGIVILDTSDRIVNINKGFQDLFKYSLDEVKGHFLNDIIVPENSRKEGSEYSNRVLTGSVVREEALRLRKDGSLVDVYILGYPIVFEGRQVGIYGIYRDITERKKAQEKIIYLSFHDKLTDLYNRAFFEEELKRLDTERQLPVSVVMGDLNNLKLANDFYGHAEGDKLLVQISKILRSCCREEDIVARWGGDEFVILLPKTGKETAVRICDRIRKACEECREGPIRPSIALGVSTKEDMNKSMQKVLTEAEHNMYRNKLIESSNTRHSIFSSIERYL